MVRKSNFGSENDGAARIRRRAEARRLEILRAAGRVFRRRGFAETGMREIAAEADLSPGNLYHYFQGKHEILYFCQDRTLDQMLAALEGSRRSGRPHDERLRAVILAHVHCLLDEVEGSAAHLEVESLPDELREAIIAKRDRYERGLRRLVSGGVREGRFAPCDPKLVTRAMLGAINWTARWFRSDGPRPASSVAGDVADYLIRGLLARPAATGEAGAGEGASR
jgi:AcrR family transcriptional regulator